MSDTPKTDMFCRTVDHTAIVGGKIYQATIETVDASFARQLERELAEARAEIDAMQMGKMSPCDYYTSKESEENLCRELFERDKLIEQMRSALVVLRKYPYTYKTTGQGSIVIDNDLAQCDAALSAAERGGK